MKFFSIYDDEAFVVKNAYLIAEGALAYIILNTLCTIKKCPFLCWATAGWANRLQNLKRQSGRCYGGHRRYRRVRLGFHIRGQSVYPKRILSQSGEYEAIINTIPVKILKGEKLKLLHPECFVLDLASKPGGIDYNDAINYGVKHMHALGVPGKVAPKTAGLYIKECVVKRLKTL